jgi:histidine triad (HIT) family protein
MQDSIFTKIIKGEIPCHKVYEDALTFAFLDIHPAVEGHVLVIPKRQVEFLWDLDDADYNAVMATSKKLALHLRTVMNVPYVGVKVVGVDVPHAHVHLLPFTTSDEYSRHGDMDAEADHAKLAELAAKLAI